VTGNPQNSGPGRSLDIRAELLAISAGFDKLLALSAIGGQLVGVNAGGSALETKGIMAAGQWTPVFSFVTPGDLAITYGLQSGRYLRIGGLVLAWFTLEMSPFTHTTASGQAKITGLPYPSVFANGLGIVHLTNVTFVDQHITPYVDTGSVIQFIGSTSGATDTGIGATHFLSGTSKRLFGMVVYPA
jgi:hypothetical protein